MTSLATKFITKKILGETASNKFGQEDLYFETVPASRLDGTPSGKKVKKRRKAVPAGISKNDELVLTKVKRRAYRLDMSLFNFCGIRFGWSSVIGIVPGFGDLIDVFMALMVLRTCDQVDGGLPNTVRSKMMFNIVLDFVVGLVPFVGDLADAVFRANTRNALELERHLRDKGAKILKEQGIPLPNVDPVDPNEFDKYDRTLSEDGPPAYQSRPITQHEEVSPYEAGGRQRGSWFGYGGGRSKQHDPEQGRSEPLQVRVEEPRAPSKVHKSRR